MRLQALDLCCSAGGAAWGLIQAGYDVLGVDINPQPRYPGRFVQGDARDWLARDLSAFDLIWASPPCQGYSELTPAAYRVGHDADLLIETLAALRAQQVPYIVENVEGARRVMHAPVMLCGSMFGLNVWRHRWFEVGPAAPLILTPPCNHSFAPTLVSGRGSRKVNGRRRKEDTRDRKAAAMGIDWMIEAELTQAIPPAYSYYLAMELRRLRVAA